MRHFTPRSCCSILNIAKKCLSPGKSGQSTPTLTRQQWRAFHASQRKFSLQPYLLADIGEGITECEIIQWFVKPGDKIEQFEALCEVQSDKAAVEITSRFDGTIKSLHYEVGDMAIVGRPLVDIEVDGGEEEKEAVDPVHVPVDTQRVRPLQDSPEIDLTPPAPQIMETSKDGPSPVNVEALNPPQPDKLATPAVRHMLKEFGINIDDVEGTGRAGLVTKEDVQRHQSARRTSTQAVANQPVDTEYKDSVSELTPVQRQMFQAMTRSLEIPHFLFTDVANVTELDSLRRRLNEKLTSKDGPQKLSLLPFILKALSRAFTEHKTLNSHLDTQSRPDRPRLLIRGSHNFGIAIDTPSGLLVPVVRNVQNHSILSLAGEIDRLGVLARTGKLQPLDFKDATFIVSNMGSIGGNAVAPVISHPMVGILGIGRAHEVPAFQRDLLGNEVVVKRTHLTLSWSGDHRVLDGATVAKCARTTALLLEDVGALLVELK